jgi:hypothetical protein
MFAGKARGLPQSGAPERCFTRVGSSLSCKHATRMETLARENTLAYYKNPLITAVKSFIAQAPGLKFDVILKFCKNPTNFYNLGPLAKK